MLWIGTISKSLYIAFVSNSLDHWGMLFWLTESYYDIFLVSYNRFPVAQVNMAEVHARCSSWYDQRNCHLRYQVAVWMTAVSDCSSQVDCFFWTNYSNFTIELTNLVMGGHINKEEIWRSCSSFPKLSIVIG